MIMFMLLNTKFDGITKKENVYLCDICVLVNEFYSDTTIE